MHMTGAEKEYNAYDWALRLDLASKPFLVQPIQRLSTLILEVQSYLKLGQTKSLDRVQMKSGGRTLPFKTNISRDCQE